MEHKLSISTGCCEESNKHKVVKLMFDIDFHTFESYLKMKPKWTAKGFKPSKYHEDEFHEQHIEVSNCPFCGVKTPEIELNQYAIDNFKIHDSDLDYCTICNERNMCCQCLPPTFRWKPIGVDIEIPIIENNNDE